MLKLCCNGWGTNMPRPSGTIIVAGLIIAACLIPVALIIIAYCLEGK